ncbi:MAG: Toxin translocation ATP-binding protein, partial [Pseudomonadota bacterium]
MNSLQAALQRLAQLQRQSLDKHALIACIDKAQTPSAQKTLQLLKSQMNWKSVQWLNN